MLETVDGSGSGGVFVDENQASCGSILATGNLHLSPIGAVLERARKPKPAAGERPAFAGARSPKIWDAPHPQGYRELRDRSGLSAISRRKRALTDPISPGWRLNLARFFHQVAERGRKVKVRDCPAHPYKALTKRRWRAKIQLPGSILTADERRYAILAFQQPSETIQSAVLRRPVVVRR